MHNNNSLTFNETLHQSITDVEQFLPIGPEVALLCMRKHCVLLKLLYFPYLFSSLIDKDLFHKNTNANKNFKILKTNFQITNWKNISKLYHIENISIAFSINNLPTDFW